MKEKKEEKDYEFNILLKKPTIINSFLLIKKNFMHKDRKSLNNFIEKSKYIQLYHSLI